MMGGEVMTHFEALRRYWDRTPRSEEEAKEKLYAIESVLNCISAELKRLEQIRGHYRDFGWLPGSKEGREFRRMESETRSLLMLIEEQLKKLKKFIYKKGW